MQNKIYLLWKKHLSDFSLHFCTNYLFCFFLIFIFLVLYTKSALAAFEDLPVGGRSLGIGSAYVAVAQGPESIFSNPAGFSQVVRPAFCFFVTRPYGLKELTYEVISLYFPTKYGGFGLGLQTFGNNLYRENTLAIGWGSKYKDKFLYGFLIKTFQLQIRNYGKNTVLTFDLGCLLKVAENINFGFATGNITHGRIGKQKDTLPQVTRVGVSYTPIYGVLLSFEFDKDVRFPGEMRWGMEISPLSILSLRCGFGRNPSHVSFGLGIAWGIFRFDYALTAHLILGLTHYGSFSIDLNKSGK